MEEIWTLWTFILHVVSEATCKDHAYVMLQYDITLKVPAHFCNVVNLFYLPTGQASGHKLVTSYEGFATATMRYKFIMDN